MLNLTGSDSTVSMQGAGNVLWVQTGHGKSWIITAELTMAWPDKEMPRSVGCMGGPEMLCGSRPAAENCGS